MKILLPFFLFSFCFSLYAQNAQIADHRGLSQFAREHNFTVTSTTGGNHNHGSAHYQGRAVDVRTRDKTPQQVERFINDARNAGIHVRDERVRPQGQRVWSGPHLHLEVSRPQR